MNILNLFYKLFKRDTEDSEPMLVDDIVEDEELHKMLNDPHYFTKMYDDAMANPNTIFGATTTEDVDHFPHPHDEPFNDRQ